MPIDRLEGTLSAEVAALVERGTAKGREHVVRAVLPAEGARGPRYLLEDAGDRPFLRMNSNSYLGLALRADLARAEEEATRAFGVGPGAVRFISGTYTPHVELERRLAAFHGREAGMIFSSAYATTLGVLVPLITAETAVISDELNHNCIINAMRLARPRSKAVYRHLDLGELETALAAAADDGAARAVVVTDGIFSMRGDHAPLDAIAALVDRWDARFSENALLVVDDSHGVGAFGETGRGTEEATGARRRRAGRHPGQGLRGQRRLRGRQPRALIDYLRETAPLYIYSNPITCGEAAAALRRSRSSTARKAERCCATCAR
jgi:glycine C-acetyltransferase